MSAKGIEEDAEVDRKEETSGRVDFSRLSRSQGDGSSLTGFANRYFRKYARKLLPLFPRLRQDLKRANLGVLVGSYMSLMILATIGVGVFSVLVLAPVMFFVELPIIAKVVLGVVIPFLTMSLTFSFLLVYPSLQANARRENMEMNLPFALSQMNAVASARVPPSAMFQLLTSKKEYGAISDEADKIAMRIRFLGEDVTTAMRAVAKDTPSDEFREVLYGLLSTIEKGGNMHDFLEERSKTSIFDYRIKIKKHIQDLGIFAAVYMALLVAMPLFLIATLAIMSTLGGDIMGYPVTDVMKFSVWVILPFLNVAFLTVLVATQKNI